jgi:signal transduction histidine kinase
LIRIKPSYRHPPYSGATIGFLQRAIGFFRGQIHRRAQPYQPLDLGNLTSAQLAHDLRHQLSVVTECADELARLLPAGRGAAELAALRRSAYWASVLTELIVRPSSVNRQAVTLNHVVAPVIATLSHLMGREITVNVDLTPEAVEVLATPAELESILLNLVLNARNAMPFDGVLTIETVIASSSYVQLTVIHSGYAVAPDLKQEIFDPLAPKPRGPGLGLRSVGYIVGQLGGTLSITSEPGAGTSVTITLPLVGKSPPA